MPSQIRKNTSAPRASVELMATRSSARLAGVKAATSYKFRPRNKWSVAASSEALAPKPTKPTKSKAVKSKARRKPAPLLSAPNSADVSLPASLPIQGFAKKVTAPRKATATACHRLKSAAVLCAPPARKIAAPPQVAPGASRFSARIAGAQPNQGPYFLRARPSTFSEATA